MAAKSCKLRGIAAVVIDGAVRDSKGIQDLQVPHFSRAVTPNSGDCSVLGDINVPIQCGGVVVNPGDVIVGGRNFGCGSSREHAPLAIKEAGISVVVARSFARIFYRNAFNIGLPLLESEEAADAFSEGDRVLVDLGSGEIKEDGDRNKVMAKSIPDFMMEIVQAGGLVKYIKEKGEF